MIKKQSFTHSDHASWILYASYVPVKGPQRYYIMIKYIAANSFCFHFKRILRKKETILLIRLTCFISITMLANIIYRLHNIKKGNHTEPVVLYCLLIV
jgi:hypothetical protein